MKMAEIQMAVYIYILIDILKKNSILSKPTYLIKR